MFYVYIIRSLKNSRLYTGSTDNLGRRLEEHNSGRSKYTKALSPFVLEYTEEFLTRSEAYKREMFFKSGKGREVLKEILRARA